MDNLPDRITIDNEVCNGRPTICGHRPTVQTVIEFILAGSRETEYPEFVHNGHIQVVQNQGSGGGYELAWYYRKQPLTHRQGTSGAV